MPKATAAARATAHSRVPPKPAKAKDYPRGWEWFREVSAFRHTHKLHNIPADSPQVFKLDQYIKQILDGLRTHQPEVVQCFGGSPLDAFRAITRELLAQDGLKDRAHAFLKAVHDRLTEDIAFRDTLKKDPASPAGNAARTALRQRGLLKK